MQVKVVDREGRIVPMGTPGELWVRGYSIMLKYWNDEKQSHEFMHQNRWARTGYVYEHKLLNRFHSFIILKWHSITLK